MSATATGATTSSVTLGSAVPAIAASGWTSQGWSATFDSIPSTATPLTGANLFIDGGNVWYGNSNPLTSVTSAAGFDTSNSSGAIYTQVNYMKGGKARGWTSQGWSATFDSIPSTATPLTGANLFIDGGNVWYGNSNPLTGVTSAAGFDTSNSSGAIYTQVNYMKGGKARGWTSQGWSATFDSIPSTATPLTGANLFIDGSDVWYGNTKVLTGVTSAAGLDTSNSSGAIYTAVNYMKSSAC